MVCGGKSSFGVAAGLIISVVLVSCTFPKLEVAPGYKGESSTSASSWLGGKGWFGAAATEIGALPRMMLAVGVVILAGVCLWQRQDKEISSASLRDSFTVHNTPSQYMVQHMQPIWLPAAEYGVPLQP